LGFLKRRKVGSKLHKKDFAKTGTKRIDTEGNTQSPERTPLKGKKRDLSN